MEHPAGFDDATLADWATRGTMYVPTIDHKHFYADNASLLGYTSEQVVGLDSFRLFNLETARRAHNAGVRVAPGFYADIVAVEGDPLANIDVVLDRVRWVMKGGAVVVDKR